MKRLLPFLFLLGAMSAENLAVAQTWTQFTLATNNYWPTVAMSADGMQMVAVQDDPYRGVSGIYKSTNSGATWFKTSAPTNLHFQSIISSADGSRIAAVSENGIHSTTNGGETWGLTGATSGKWWNLISSADGVKLAALTNNDTTDLYFSTNAGATWIKPTNAANPSFWASLAMSANGTKIVGQIGGRQIGEGALTTRSTNGGVTWYVMTNAPKYEGGLIPSQNIAMSADGIKIVLAYTASGKFTNGNLKPSAIYLSTNSGETWLQTGAPSNYWQNVVMSADGKRIVAVGNSKYSLINSSIFTSTNSGDTWVSNALPQQEWLSLACSADGAKIIAGAGHLYQAGGIYLGNQLQRPTPISVASTNGQLKLAWPLPSTNLVLQQSSDLQNWMADTNPPALNTDNMQNEVIVPATNGKAFFRLATP